ncbi:MAG: hypothetical protein Q9166_006257 [cf. Caloplaca sp. 2 TL-2023]
MSPNPNQLTSKEGYKAGNYVTEISETTGEKAETNIKELVSKPKLGFTKDAVPPPEKQLLDELIKAVREEDFAKADELKARLNAERKKAIHGGHASGQPNNDESTG